ncbi:DUF397 domain-containing protein [Actinomadura keratinilytica]
MAGTASRWPPTSSPTHGLVPVRDSKNPSGPVLTFSAAAFSSFVAGAQAGEFRFA